MEDTVICSECVWVVVTLAWGVIPSIKSIWKVYLECLQGYKTYKPCRDIAVCVGAIVLVWIKKLDSNKPCKETACFSVRRGQTRSFSVRRGETALSRHRQTYASANWCECNIQNNSDTTCPKSHGVSSCVCPRNNRRSCGRFKCVVIILKCYSTSMTQEGANTWDF